MERRDVITIKKRLNSGESAYKVAKDMDLGYMAVYKIGIGETWKDVGPSGRLIPEREGRMTSEHRDWAWKMKHKKRWSNGKIAKKLGVSETTVARLLVDARLLLGARVHQMLLTSGNNEAAIRTYKLTADEVEDLINLSTTTALPRKLRKELEE